MAEITLNPGARVREAGKSYRVADTAVVDVDLIEVKAQVNRHAKLVCQHDACIAVRTTKAGTHCRVSDLGAIQESGYWPMCGQCGGVMSVVPPKTP